MATSAGHESGGRSSSRNRAQTPPPRPTTPLRPPSRNSLRSSQTPTHGASYRGPIPIDALEPQLAEVADGMADLEANFMHLQLMHESLARFSECFAAFLHGLKVNAFCVDFPEAPVAESFRRAMQDPILSSDYPPPHSEGGGDVDQTFLTTDTSFIENPPTSSVKGGPGPSSVSTPKAPKTPVAARGARAGQTRGTQAGRAGAGAGRGRTSGLARATSRGRGRAR